MQGWRCSGDVAASSVGCVDPLAAQQTLTRTFLRSQSEAFASVLDGKQARLFRVLAGFVVSQWLLVPLHELLHVLGCVATGGIVSRLEIGPLYGGGWFARLAPWITSGGDYAGRLSGFRPAGDLSYLTTVLAPLLALCPIGSAVARAAVRRHRALLFGIGLGAALQPIASLTGDSYEAASIPLTRLADVAGLHWAIQLRGDDVFKVAREAAALGSPLAWLLFAAGCVGAALIAVLILTLSGGIAPRGVAPTALSPTPDAGGIAPGARRPVAVRTRRSVLRTLSGVMLIGAGGWILRIVLIPRRLKPAEVETVSVLLDTLIPDGEFPGAKRTGILEPLLRECASTWHTARALLRGVQWLEQQARAHGAAEFRGLPLQDREQIVAQCAAAAEGTLPRVFYRTVRDRAIRLHYAHPFAWQRVGLPHAPQPYGYPDHWAPPDV